MIIYLYKAECNDRNMLVLFMLVPNIIFVPLIHVSPTDLIIVVSTKVFILVPQFSC